MTILLTAGEPAGIGPDITLKLLAESDADDLIVVADSEMLAQRATQTGIVKEIVSCDNYADAVTASSSEHITVLHHPVDQPVTAGQLEAANSRYVLDCLDTAAALCRDVAADAMVTGPVHKGIINDAGIPFSGHTEYLAEPTDSTPVMMLTTRAMRVFLATTHLPLRDVADALSIDLIVEKLSIADDFLKQRFRIESPHILVCGLNPHAGEDGHLGREEIDIIEPALERCRQQGIHVTGPLPADTLFTRHWLPQADAVLSMFHDQGLPVLKYSGFGEAVNITMGLPFIRTSVDHGTALSLAGTGEADHNSLAFAIDIARELI